MKKLIFALFCALIPYAHADPPANTPVIASKVIDNQGNLLASGQFCVGSGGNSVQAVAAGIGPLINTAHKDETLTFTVTSNVTSFGAVIRANPSTGAMVYAVFSTSNIVLHDYNPTGPVDTVIGTSSTAPTSLTGIVNLIANGTSITAVLNGATVIGTLPGGTVNNNPATSTAVGMYYGSGGSTFFVSNLFVQGIPLLGQPSGNTSTYATVSGALTPGNFVKSDSNGNIVDGGAGNVVCESGPQTAVVGNGATQTVYSCTVPANTVTAGGCLDVDFSTSGGTYTNTINKTVGLNVGSTVIETLSYTGTQARQSYQGFHWCNNSGVTNAQHAYVAMNVISNTPSAPATSTIDTTASTTFTITFNAPATETILVSGVLVRKSLR